MRLSPVVLCGFGVLTWHPAWAGSAEAAACAQALPAQAQEVYQAVAPEVAQGGDMERVMRAKVVPMVMLGEMNRSSARRAAEAASVCLQRLRPAGGAMTVAAHGTGGGGGR